MPQGQAARNPESRSLVSYLDCPQAASSSAEKCLFAGDAEGWRFSNGEGQKECESYESVGASSASSIPISCRSFHIERSNKRSWETKMEQQPTQGYKGGTVRQLDLPKNG